MYNTVIASIQGTLCLAACAVTEPWWMHPDLLCTDWFLSWRWKCVRTAHVFSADANGFLSNGTCGDHRRNSYGLHLIKEIHRFQSPALSAEVMTLWYCNEDQCKAMGHGGTRLVWSSGASYDPGVLSALFISWSRVRTLGCRIGRDFLVFPIEYSVVICLSQF